MASIQIDETLRLVRTDTARPLTSLICAAAVGQGDLVLGTADGLVQVARRDGPTQTYSLLALDDLPRRSPITTIRACNDFVFLMQSPSNRILQIDKSFDETIRFISFGNDTILSFDIDRSGFLLAGDANGEVYSWHLHENHPVSVILSEKEPIAAVAVDSDSQSAFIVTRSGCIIAYDASTSQAVASSEYKFQATMAAAWFAHHGVIVADASGRVLVTALNESRFEKAHEWAETAVVVGIAVHRSGEYVALGMVNGHVVVRSLQDPAVIFGQVGMDSAVVAVEFVDDSDAKSPRLLIASYNGSLQIWPVNVHNEKEPPETTDVQHDSAKEDIPQSPEIEPRNVAPDPNLSSCQLVTDDRTQQCSVPLATVAAVDDVPRPVTNKTVLEDADNLLQPRSGPVPTPEPPPLPPAEQVRSVELPSHSLPEVGLAKKDIADVPEPRSLSAVPKPIEPCRSVVIAPSVQVGRFSSKKRIDGVLGRSGRLPSDSVLAAPSLNSTNWIQYQIDQLATTALQEPPEIDLRVVTERAATKALHVDHGKTGFFGELPSIEVELPPPSRPQIQKQVDPKWVRSLDRKPIMEAFLNRDDLEPQIPGHDSNWSLSSSAHQRSSVETDVATQMGALFLQRISYWQQGLK